MKRILPLLLLAGSAVATVTNSCQDSQGDIGSSIVADQLEIIVDSSFTVSGRSILNPRVQSRTTTQLLGAIRAHNYGILRSDYMAEMLPASTIDTFGIDASAIDSVKLLLAFDRGGFVGDSLATIGINVYRLSKPLPYPVFSDDTLSGYVDRSKILGSAAFAAAAFNDSMSSSAYRYVYITLPKSTGVEFFEKYKEDPTLFSDPIRFNKEFFSGFYVEQAFGSGRVTRITDTRWVMYYHRTYNAIDSLGQPYDSIVPTWGMYMAAAPEMVANSNIRYTPDEFVTKAVNDGHTLVVSPAAYDVEVTFPLESIMERYRTQAGDLSVINDLSFKIPASMVENDKGIGMPVNMLLILSRDKEEFFAKNKLPDNVSSFNAAYSATDTGYVFSGMRGYLLDMLAKDPAEITPADYTFTLTPIALETESSASSSYYYSSSTPTINAVTPMVAMPSMVELGLDKSQIKLTFSKRNIKNN